MIIAEIGSVHDGSLGNAKKLIEVAKNSGANFVKFQMHNANEETLKDAFTPDYFSEEKRFEYFNRTSFSIGQWKSLIKHSKLKKIDFMCSVFSIKAFDILFKLRVRNIKIPSGELTNLPLLKSINKKKGLNIFLSTGMSSWNEIDEALKMLNNHKVILMQCSSIYPCPETLVGLNVIKEMKLKYANKYNYGFSDHTTGSEAAICSIVYGAKYIEKHITFSKKMYGSDAKFAMEPKEFKNFCESVKKTKKIISNPVNKNNLKPFIKMKKTFEKRIIAKRNLNKGIKIKFEDLSFKKSNKGIKVFDYKKILGKILKKRIFKDQSITQEYLK